MDLNNIDIKQTDEGISIPIATVNKEGVVSLSANIDIKEGTLSDSPFHSILPIVDSFRQLVFGQNNGFEINHDINSNNFSEKSILSENAHKIGELLKDFRCF